MHQLEEGPTIIHPVMVAILDLVLKLPRELSDVYHGVIRPKLVQDTLHGEDLEGGARVEGH